MESEAESEREYEEEENIEKEVEMELEGDERKTTVNGPRYIEAESEEDEDDEEEYEIDDVFMIVKIIDYKTKDISISNHIFYFSSRRIKIVTLVKERKLSYPIVLNQKPAISR